MANLCKLIDRLLRLPPEADFSDVQKVLEDFGWTHDRTRGSHHSFTKDRHHPITVPTVSGTKVKRTYIKKIAEELGLEDYYEENCT